MEPENDTIDDTNRILRLIEKAMQEDVVIEVQINEKTRIFYSRLLDHPPPPPEEEPPPPPVEEAHPVLVEGEAPPPPPKPKKKVEVYVPRSYLFKRDHLLLEPLVPAVGNALIRTSYEVMLRFFQGVRAIEGKVTFQEVITLQDDHAICVSFPRSITILRKRRHFRAKVMPELGLTVVIKSPQNPPFTTNLIDISVGGLAFCNGLGEAAFPVAEKIEMLIQPQSFPSLSVTGFVRNHARASVKDGCQRDQGRCGVQYDLLSEKMAMRMEELVAYVQREHLQRISEMRGGHAPAPMPEPEPAPEPEKPNVLMSLFTKKKDYRFKP